MENLFSGKSRLLARAETRREPSMQEIARAVEELGTAHTQFLSRNNARIDELQNGLNVVNERAQLHGLAPDHPTTPGLSTATRQAICDVLRGQASSLPSAGLTSSDDPAGGYGVVPLLDELITSTVRRQNALRSHAAVITLPMGVGSYQKVLSKRGAGAGWAAQLDTRSETTNPEFGRAEVTPREAYAKLQASQWLLDDNGVGLEQWLAEDVASAISELEGEAFINGTGGKQPRGLMTYNTSAELDDSTRPFGTIAYVPTGASGAFLETSASPERSPADVLIDLTLALNASYRANAIWLMSSSTAGIARKWKDQDGRYIWQDSLQAGEPAMLLGYPVEIDESMPSVAADSMSIAFGDFNRAYVIVDRPGIRLVSDPFTTPGMINSYWFRRVGGGLLDSRAVKFLKFGTS